MPRKRATSTKAAPTPDPAPQLSLKRQKRSPKPHNRSSREFWDNLSRLWLTCRAIQEFDRRTVQPIIPKPEKSSDLKGDSVKELKRFVRHGGPSLRDLRGVGPSGS